MHEVALVDDQFNVELAPLMTVSGLALMVTLGAAAATATVTDCVAHPLSPVHVRSNSVALASAPVDCDPLVDNEPLQPPEAWQDEAFSAFQVSVELAPPFTVEGFAVSVTVGVAVTVT